MNESHIRRRPEGVLLRTYLTAAGVSPESNAKPLIGVASCSTQVFSEKSLARELATSVRFGIEGSDGLPRWWDTTRSPEMMSWGHADGYSFAWRDQLADLVESWAKQEALEGLVLVGDAPESLIGMAMAAARLNIPAVVVPINSQRWEFSHLPDAATVKKKDFGDPYEMLTEILFGKKKSIQDQDKERFSQCLMAVDNHESNAVYFVLEALGTCLPGLSTASNKIERLKHLAQASGERVVNLVKSGTTFRRILTANAFSNAVHLNAALGGSIDVAVHLMALANEAGVPLSLDFFDKVSRATPQLAHLSGSFEKQTTSLEEFDLAGGVWAVLHALKNAVHPTLTVGGKGAAELAKSTMIRDGRTISESKPLRKQSGIGVLKGSLAPTGALFLLNQVAPELLLVKGTARIFDQEILAAQAVSQGEIKKGTILVVRGQGPKGGPGLKKLRILPALLESRGLSKAIPVLTDGRLPDNPQGLFISCISPEGGVRSPFGVLKDGDEIDIDVVARSISIRLTQTELQIRLVRWQEPQTSNQRGFLARYSRSVSEISEGAILK